MHTFKLCIEKEKSRLSLLNENKEIAVKEWPEDRDMGRSLFRAIAELLEDNGLKPEQVSEFVVDSEMPDNYTSARIAETVKKVYAFGASFPR